MFNKEQKGILSTARKLAAFVSDSEVKDGSYEINQYAILNANDDSTQRLAGEFSSRRTTNDILRNEYGISSDRFTLLLVRLIAFGMINTRNAGFSWYESALLGTIKERIPKSG